MADITKCVDKKCPSAVHCYRWTAQSNPNGQSFADFNRQENEDSCDAYEPVSPKPQPQPKP